MEGEERVLGEGSLSGDLRVLLRCGRAGFEGEEGSVRGSGEDVVEYAIILYCWSIQVVYAMFVALSHFEIGMVEAWFRC